MRVMAVDYGDTRTGVAFSDATGTLAGESLVITEYSAGRLAEKLAALYHSRGAALLVLGLPLNMDGTRGVRAEKSEALGALLAAQGLPVEFIDERRTTIDAHRILTETGRHGKKRKETVDAVAAALILETWLNGHPTK